MLPRCTARRRALLASALALALSAGFSAHAHAATWLEPMNVSGAHTSAGCSFLEPQPGVASVQVAVDGRGDTIVVWTQRVGTEQHVRAAIRPAGGTFGPAQMLGETFPCYLLSFIGAAPALAAGANGDAVVVWAHPLAATTVIQASVRRAGGAFGPAVTLSDGGRTAGRDPDVAIAADGSATAVWSWHDGANTVIQAARRAPGGAFPPPGGAQTLSAAGRDASAPRVAMNDRGDTAVVWTRSNGANRIAQARVRRAGAAYAGAVNLSASGADAAAPAVALDPAGRATAVWLRANHVESRFLTAAGALDGGVDDVSDAADAGGSPSVALDAANNAVAVWTGNNSTKAAWRASRASFSPPQAISAPGDANALPRVVMDAHGGAVAVWSQGLTAVQAARRPAGGSFGGVTDLTRPPGKGVDASAAADHEGNVVAAWTFARTGGQRVAQLAVYDAAPPRLTSVAVPALAALGVPAAMSAAASDRYSGAALSWNFGDGTTASGPQVAHAYGAPGVYTVTVTATDGAGNAVSEQRAIQVAAPPPAVVPSPPPARPASTPSIEVTVAFSYKAARRWTRFTRFTVKRVPRGATVRVSCRPPKRAHRKRPRCPARTYRTKARRSSVRIKRFLRKRFVARTRIEVRVTQRGKVGAVKLLRIRKRNGPSIATRCLPPGERKYKRC